MLSPIDKLLYTARQSARVAWYMGHYFASRRYHVSERKAEPQPEQPAKPRQPGPGRDRMLADMAALFARDLANAEAGHYPLPRDHDGGLTDILAASRRYFSDLPSTIERKADRRGHEIQVAELNRNLPDYFLQNFHYQTDGYLTEHSARLYDIQVEVLFSGSANAMRRQCLVPLSEFITGRDQRKLRLLDVACGTGVVARAAADLVTPEGSVTGVDLNPAMLAVARRVASGCLCRRRGEIAPSGGVHTGLRSRHAISRPPHDLLRPAQRGRNASPRHCGQPQDWKRGRPQQGETPCSRVV